MKIAQTIAEMHPSEAIDTANEKAIDYIKSWSSESIQWIFADNSIFYVCGAESIGVDADSEESIKAYGKWLDNENDAEVLALLDALHAQGE